MPVLGICVRFAQTSASTTARRWPNWASPIAGYVQERADQWATDTVYTWAVCEPTTGEMLAEVTLYR